MRILDRIAGISLFAQRIIQSTVQAGREATAAVGVLIEHHKLVRRLLVAWAAGLITWVTVRVFGGPLADITGNVVAAYTVTCGLLTIVLGLYQVQRSKEGG